jgi:hypothetical protein
LRGALLAVGVNFLVGDLALGEDLDEVFRKNDVLDINTARFDAVLVELFFNVFEGLFLDLLPSFDEANGGMLCSLSRKWLPTAACRTSLTRFIVVPTMEITRGALVSGT